MKFRNEDFDCVVVVEAASANYFTKKLAKLASQCVLVDVQYNARPNGRGTIYSALVLIKNNKG